MPVVTLHKDRLERLVGRRLDEIKAVLPYIALDIEDESYEYIKVEYNPNRPDYSTDYGIARALKGLMDVEVGMPKIDVARSDVRFIVDSTTDVRPYIVGLLALNGRMDEEDIRQLISMQEDLHMGIGRRRRKASIGIHDYDKVKPPFYYTTVDSGYSFVPLNHRSSMSIKDILSNTDVGREYAYILDTKRYPIIRDSRGDVLSFPPIINADLTRVSENSRNLLVEVTATDLNAAYDILAVIAVTLCDMGFSIGSVEVRYENKNGSDYRDHTTATGSIVTPDMKSRSMSLGLDYVNSILGLDLDASTVVNCLKRCRSDAYNHDDKIECVIPRYRIDIMSAIDVVEDVMIGYNVSRLEPRYPRLKATGIRDKTLRSLEYARDILVGLGMIEVMNFSLVSYDLQYKMMNRANKGVIRVKESKSREHEILRDMLLPSLLDVLSRNVHEPYPQMLFEIGKVFSYDAENYNVACVIADAEADYTRAKSYLQAFVRHLLGYDVITEPMDSPYYEYGRAADIKLKEKVVGSVGEISKSVLENFRIKVRVSAFELDLSELLKM